MPILSIQKNSFQEPSSRNDPFSSMFQLAQAPLLRGDPIFGVRGAVFGVRAVKGAGGAVLGVTGWASLQSVMMKTWQEWSLGGMEKGM